MCDREKYSFTIKIFARSAFSLDKILLKINMGSSQSATRKNVKNFCINSHENIYPSINNTKNCIDYKEKFINNYNKQNYDTKYPTLSNVNHYQNDFTPSCPPQELVEVNYYKKREFNIDYKSTELKHYAPSENKNILKYMYKPPEEFKNLEHFIRNWIGWKAQLESYLTQMNVQGDYYQWGSFLLNRMGPVGYQILENLTFNQNEDKNNFAVLINKFDAYYKFHHTKSKNKCVTDQIPKLKPTAVKDSKNIDDKIKQKGVEKIKTCRKCNKSHNICICFKSKLISNCRFCGRCHEAKRSTCPANTNICIICKSVGHYPTKCLKYTPKRIK